MPPKVGDIVFAKTFDVYTEESSVRPGIVTRVFTESDGEWAKDREIATVSLFGGPNGPEDLDMDKGTTDDAGDWVAGGWADSYDGPSKASATPEPTWTMLGRREARAPGDPVNSGTPVSTSPSDPASGTVGSLGTSADNPASDPSATSGASTSTVADGSDAPVTQPV